MFKLIWSDRKFEDVLPKYCLLTVLLGHLALYFLSYAWSGLRFISNPVSEWEIDTELMSDFGLGMPEADPNSSSKDEPMIESESIKKAEDDKVAANLLPQLTKDFAIQKPEEQSEDGEELDKKSEKDELQLKKEEEEKKALELKKADALKRLALEKLRLKAEKDHENTLKKERALNEVKAQSAKEISSSGAGLSLGSSYEAKLNRHFRKCISVPRAYVIEGQKLVVGVEVRLAENGAVISSKVVQESGNQILDDLALEGVKKCSPAPAPRKELVNVPIVVEVGPQ